MVDVGMQIGNYRLVRKLGEGNFGAVFAGEHIQIGRKAAIKVLHPSAQADPLTEVRFLNEARSVNQVQHNGLVEIYEIGQLPDSTRYIIMEYLDGETLSALLKREGALPNPYGLALIRQTAQALSATHEKGIVHRDLKPDNLMLVGDREGRVAGVVKVLDFGIAKSAQAEKSEGPKTQHGAVVGTPKYMSPEQCNAEVLTGKSDVYSLGMICYELFSGQHPFQSRTVVEMFMAHMMKPVPPLGTVAPKLSSKTVALVHRMLEKDPSLRPTMAEVAAELTKQGADDSFQKVEARFRPRTHGGKTSGTMGEQKGSVGTSSVDGFAREAASSRLHRYRLWIALAGLVAVVALLGLGARHAKRKALGVRQTEGGPSANAAVPSLAEHKVEQKPASALIQDQSGRLGSGPMVREQSKKIDAANAGSEPNRKVQKDPRRHKVKTVKGQDGIELLVDD